VDVEIAIRTAGLDQAQAAKQAIDDLNTPRRRGDDRPPEHAVADPGGRHDRRHRRAVASGLRRSPSRTDLPSVYRAAAIVRRFLAHADPQVRLSARGTQELVFSRLGHAGRPSR